MTQSHRETAERVLQEVHDRDGRGVLALDTPTLVALAHAHAALALLEPLPGADLDALTETILSIDPRALEREALERDDLHEVGATSAVLRTLVDWLRRAPA